MRRRRNHDLVVFGLAFLDVLAGTIGGLAFLLVMAVLTVGAGLAFPPPVIMTEVLPDAYVGQPYQIWLGAREGLGLFAWRFGPGEHPPDFALDERTGRLAGTPPPAPGDGPSRTYDFEVEVSSQLPSGETKTMRRGFTMTVRREALVSVPPLRIVAGDSLPQAFVDHEYPLTLAAEGGQPPYRWSGDAPSGLELRPDGRFAGTPDRAGTHAFDIVVETARGERAVKTVTLAVSQQYTPPPPPPPLEIITRAMPDAIADREYAIAPSVTGGVPPYRWSIAATGIDWLEPDTARSTFTGRPGLRDVTQTGVTLRVVDGVGASAQTAAMPFEILPPPPTRPPPLTIRTRTLPDGRVGEPYEIALAARGGFPPYTWRVAGLDAQSGIQLAADEGVLAGAPRATADVPVTLEVRDAAGEEASGGARLRVRPAVQPVRILTRRVPPSRAGAPLELALSAVGGHPQYHWALIAGSLPPGVVLEDSTGIIRGVPESAGNWTASLGVADAEGRSAPAPAHIDFVVLTPEGVRPLAIRTHALPVVLHRDSTDVTLASDGGLEPIIWTADALPAGLAIVDDRIAGRATETGSFDVTLTVTDASGQTAQREMRILVRNVVPYALAVLLAVLLLIALALMIWFWRMAASHRPGPLAILTRGLPNARASFDYEVQLACTGGVPPYRWSIATGGVPEGMTLEEDGRLHGRPFEGVALAATKDIPFTVVVRDTRGDEARADL